LIDFLVDKKSIEWSEFTNSSINPVIKFIILK